MKNLKKYDKNYSIGLDIGTNSVGWAVIDNDYKLINYKGKWTYGVRLFDSAETSANTRSFRCLRRRYNRRVKRIQILQELFKSEVEKIDNTFFSNFPLDTKWRNSNNFENNSLSEVCIKLNINPNLTYPTIYHLRADLITTKEKKDLRLVYLAIHNLIKYRGHYLMESSTNDIKKIDISVWRDTIDNIEGLPNINNDNLLEIIKELKTNNLNKTDRINNSIKILEKENKLDRKSKDKLKLFLSLILGREISLSKFLEKEDLFKISFSSEEYDKDFDKLSETEIELFEDLYKIYLDIQLTDIIKDKNTIAEAKVSEYNEFKIQLKNLKEYIKLYHKESFNKLFNSSKESIKLYNQNKDTKKDQRCLFDKYLTSIKEAKTFFDELQKVLKEDLNSNDISKVSKAKNFLDLLNENKLLKKLVNIENASIPNQLNVIEIKKILENQKKYYPELITDDFINKIVSITEFRIPYYVGPIVNNPLNSRFSWMIKNNNISEPIRPWNFNELINVEQSSTNFIKRMIKKCTYLSNEDVMAKNAITYQLFEVYNELNGCYYTRHEGDNKKIKFTKEERDFIINNIFKKYKKISLKTFKEIYNKAHNNEIYEVKGTQKEDCFASSLSSYIDFKNILENISNNDIETIDRIIEILTIFNDKNMRKNIIEKNFLFSNEIVDKIIKLNYSGFGNVSYKLINILPIDINNRTILDIMIQNDKPITFMQILNDKEYDLESKLLQMNDVENKTKIIYEDIEKLHGSPALKRGIWQAIKIIDEITSIFGIPKLITLEMARSDDEKKRTTSREDIWKKIKDSYDEEFINQLKNKDINYKDEKTWLYLLQGGKCMYTLKPLEFPLSNYDVDHIVPRSIIKDDSIDNKVLVIKKKNYEKKELLMPLEVIPDNEKYNVIRYWTELYKKGAISSKKYNLLIKEKLSDVDIKGFINRQLVETRQITKNVRDLLKCIYNNGTTVVTGIKAKIVSDFKDNFQIYKVRNINDYHHAKDAYSAVFIQQFINNNYGKDFLDSEEKYWFRNKNSVELNNEKQLFIFSRMNKELKNIREFLHKTLDLKPIITKKTERLTNGQFWKQTLHSPTGKKSNLPNFVGKQEKGIYTSIKKAYSLLVEYSINNKKIRKVFDVRIYETKVFKNNLDSIADYLVRTDVDVKKNQIIDNIKVICVLDKNQLLIHNEHPVYFKSSAEMNNAKQLMLTNEEIKRIKYFGCIKDNDKYIYCEEKALEDYKFIIDKLNNEYKEIIGQFRDEKLYNSLLEYYGSPKSREEAISKLEGILVISSSGTERNDNIKPDGRYRKSINLNNAYIIYQSITGLNERISKTLSEL